VGIEAEASQPAIPVRRSPIAPGHYVAALGAIALIVSLFLPWYSLNLPPGAQQALDAETEGLPESLRELGRSLVQEVLDSVGGTAWEVFSSTDIVLFVCAILVLVLALFSIATRGASNALSPATTARLIGLVGTGAAALVVVKMLDQPGPNMLLDLDYGPFVALGGAAAIAFGGWSAGERAMKTA
jgi:hypothetical protein